MTQPTQKRGWRWHHHLAWVSALNISLAVAFLVVFFGSGLGNPLLRRLIVRKLNAATGGKTEVRTLSIGWFSLRVTLNGLVIHGREPAGTPPFFSAEHVTAGLRI